MKLYLIASPLVFLKVDGLIDHLPDKRMCFAATSAALLLPSPREAVGRGRGWGATPQSRKQRFLQIPPPPPTPPRHARCAWREGRTTERRRSQIAFKVGCGVLGFPVEVEGRGEFAVASHQIDQRGVIHGV